MKESISTFWLLCLVLAACANDPTTSAEYLELESQLDTAEQQLAEAATKDAAEFKAAHESGDLEQVRALYAPDGIFAT